MTPITIHFSAEQIVEALSDYVRKHNLGPSGGVYDISVGLIQRWREAPGWKVTFAPVGHETVNPTGHETVTAA